MHNVRFFSMLLLFCPLLLGAGEKQKSRPQKVYVDFSFNEIISIDSQEQSFYADFYIRFKWYDSNIQNDEALKRAKQNDDLLVPKPDFVNAIDIEERISEEFDPIEFNEEDKAVTFSKRYAGTFSSPMNLEKFPHDDQKLSIKIEDYDLNIQKLTFVFNEKSNGYFNDDIYYLNQQSLSGKNHGNKRTRTEWSLIDIGIKTNSRELEFDADEVYSQFEIIVKKARSATFYNLKIVSVALIITLIAFISLFLDPSSLGERTGITVTSLLALIAHNYVANDILPRIPYLTALDFLLMGTQILLFLSALENLLVFIIHKKKGLVLADKIDRYCLGCLPFFIMFLVAFYLNKAGILL